jgi:anthranilate phosphoribosyltransferase
LSGKGTQAQREITILNTAAALVAGGAAENLSGGLDLAGNLLDDGTPLQKLDALVTYSQSFAQ